MAGIKACCSPLLIMVLLLPFLSLFLLASFTEPDTPLHSPSLRHIKDLCHLPFASRKDPYLPYLPSDFTIRVPCCKQDLLSFF